MSFTFTNRFGGVSETPFESKNLALHVGDYPQVVLQNREIQEDEIGMPICYMEQFHGNEVVQVEDANFSPRCDALVTTKNKLGLAVLTADCIPLLLRGETCVAAVHVGRAGLMNGVALKTLAAMEELGSERIHGIIGPSICGNCYEVSQEIYNDVILEHPAADSHSRTGKYTLDLVAALKHQISSVVIQDHGSCVKEEKNYFSYRRDGITGRQAGIIWR